MIITSFLRRLTNLLYLTSFTKKKYSKQYPEENILLCDAVKAVKLPNDKEPEYGREWITARRCSLVLSDKAVQAGSWRVPFNEIGKTELIRFQSSYGKAMFLKIHTVNDEHYQFGMQYNRVLEGQNHLKIDEIKEQKIKKSLYSYAVRIIAGGYILYLLISHFF